MNYEDYQRERRGDRNVIAEATGFTVGMKIWFYLKIGKNDDICNFFLF